MSPTTYTMPNCPPSVLNPAARLPCVTAIVIGLPRGGTSAVASVLDALGVWMGERRDLLNGGSFENPAFNQKDMTNWEGEVAKHNKLHSVWGFKNPYGPSVLKGLPSNLRNPHLIYILRDAAALAQRWQQLGWLPDRGFSQKAGFLDYLTAARQQIDRLLDSLATQTLPSLVCSYERILSAPGLFALALQDFLGLSVTVEHFADALSRISSRGGYVVPHSFPGAPHDILPST